MEYIRAEQLNHYGFPIPKGGDEEWYTYPRMFPTMAELLEECEKLVNNDTDIIITVARGGRFFVETKEFGWLKIQVEGQTMVDALAKLYIELKK